MHQVRHCSTVASEIYSSPSITFVSRNRTDNTVQIYDDMREAYYWLRQNSPDHARVLSWWDYGYQLSSMANRTVLVDNNTWNNTHIATVGRVFGSTEDEALPILQSLDVHYVLVFFGSVMGYGSDDLNKFPWFVRITGAVC